MKKFALLFVYLLLTHSLSAQNQPPVAMNDTLTLIPNTKLLGEVILNDTDPENDSITTTLLTEADGGIDITDGLLERFCANGSFCYTPNMDFVGIDTFTYILTDSLGNMDTATVFLHVILPDSITYGALARGGCTVTIWPCRLDQPDPCEIPLRPSKLNRRQVAPEELEEIIHNVEFKSLLPPNDTCDFFVLYDPPQSGNLYLTNVNDSNVASTSGVNIDSLFYYEPTLVGATFDSFGLLKCGELDDGEIYCDSLEIDLIIEYDPTCGFAVPDKYCCVSTTSTFPCDVLANDLVLIDSLFPAPDYTVMNVTIADILMQPDSGAVIINGTADSLIYDAGGFSGIDSLTYQTQFTVTNNITGETVTFLSEPQTVLILADDDCELITPPIPPQVVTNSMLCISLTNYLSVNSQLFALCPDGVECTNDPLNNYEFAPPTYVEDDLTCIPIEDGQPPNVIITVCETEYPDDCVEVVVSLVYPEKVPTLSEWRLIILALLLLIIGTVVIKTEQQRTLELSS